MLGRRSLDDLIGRIAKGIDNDGNERDLFWPKVGERKVLGMRFPKYALTPRFRRNDISDLQSRITRFHGLAGIYVKKGKVYGIRRKISKEKE